MKRDRYNYGSDYPIRRRPSIRPQLAMMASGFLAIFFFFAALVVTLHLLPGAIEAEIERQVAVVQKHLGMGLE
jgi:hypothetical protein